MKTITNVASKEPINFELAMVADNVDTGGQIKISCIKRIKSEALFTNVKEVMIEHLNETYILRLTKQNKLILTK